MWACRRNVSVLCIHVLTTLSPQTITRASKWHRQHPVMSTFRNFMFGSVGLRSTLNMTQLVDVRPTLQLHTECALMGPASQPIAFVKMIMGAAERRMWPRPRCRNGPCIGRKVRCTLMISWEGTPVWVCLGCTSRISWAEYIEARFGMPQQPAAAAAAAAAEPQLQQAPDEVDSVSGSVVGRASYSGSAASTRWPSLPATPGR